MVIFINIENIDCIQGDKFGDWEYTQDRDFLLVILLNFKFKL